MRSNGGQTRLLSFASWSSDVGRISKDGFRASWLTYDFIGPCICAKPLLSFFHLAVDNSCRVNLKEIRHRFMKGYSIGAFCPALGIHNPFTDHSDINRTLVVVCATNRIFEYRFDEDSSSGWQWRGVYEWDMAEPIPKFVWAKDVLLT